MTTKTIPSKAKTSARKAAVKNPRPKKAVTVGNATVELTDKQSAFVDEYLLDLNGTQAAIRAGYSPKTAAVVACENLIKPNIQAAIAERAKAREQRTQITADAVLREIWHVATADAREITQVVRSCCRHCYGKGGAYQWRDEAELDAAIIRTVSLNQERVKEGERPIPLPSDAGGFGYDSKLMPAAECSHCEGRGYTGVQISDTRSLSKQAASLYAGAKFTKYGIEVNLHDKMAALEKLMKHMGLYERDNEQRIDPLASLMARVTAGIGNGFAPVKDDPEAGSSLGVQLNPIDED